jgi:hypothetical protein
MTAASMTEEQKESIEFKSEIKGDVKNIKENMSRFATKEELISQASNIKADLTASENKMLEKIMDMTKVFCSTKIDTVKFFSFFCLAALGLAVGSYWNLRVEMRSDAKEMRNEMKEMRTEINASINKLAELQTLNAKQSTEFQAEMRATLSKLEKSQNTK